MQFQNLDTGRQRSDIGKNRKDRLKWFQYQQVKNLISQLLKKDNVFRPLSEFDSDRQTKIAI